MAKKLDPSEIVSFKEFLNNKPAQTPYCKSVTIEDDHLVNHHFFNILKALRINYSSRNNNIVNIPNFSYLLYHLIYRGNFYAMARRFN